MRAIQRFWLFQKEPDPLWPVKKQRWYAAWRLIALLLMSVCWGAALLVIAAGRYPKRDILGYFETPLIAALNILPVVLLSLLFYALFARAWAAFLASGLITLGFAAGNYYLLLFRDDPLMAVDLLDLFTGLGFTGQYDLTPDTWLSAVLVCFCLAVAFLLLLARGKGAGKRLRLSLLALLLVLAWPMTLLYGSDTVYQKKAVNFHYFNQWSDTQQYVSRGFLYPFLHSIGDLIPSPPPGYDEEEAAAILAGYTDEDIPAEKRVNFVSIQLEAFADFSRLGISGVDFSLYDAYHALEEESYTGDLITNIFAGGTVDTERCAITGVAALKNFRAPSNSYAWWMQAQGYTVEGSHPCNNWFYNRRNVNEYLGLTNYRYYEDYYTQLSGDYYTMDDLLFPEILRLMRESLEETGQPCFSYNVSYQNHGPYSAEHSPKNYVTGTLSDESRNILNNYLYNAEDTISEITKMVDELRSWEEPVVLLLFGDHKPWLGYGNSAYHELEVDFDLSTPQGLKNYYGTRYLIWANDAAKEALGRDFTGEGPEVSSNFLLNVLFDACGLRGSAYMQFTEEIRAELPVLTSTGYYLKDGAVRTELSAAEEEALRRYRNVSYYWREEFLFSEI
ncbi:MAG: sulfatase-like hydrolase/transferase [Oscillospiraceae bacterium]